MIKIDNLRLGFSDAPNTAVVDRLDLQVLPGEITSLFGPNGCGKSSLIHYLMGNHPTKYLSDHAKVLVLPPQSLGYVPQHSAASVMDWLTALDNIALSLVLNGTSRYKAKQRALELTQSLDPSLPLRTLGRKLSGGEKQTVVLLRELLRNPTTLVLDEGFAAMDYERRYRLMASVRCWCKENSVSVLSVGHDAEEVALFSDSVLVLGPRPSSVASVVCLPADAHRSVSSLGEEWLRDATQQIHLAFQKALQLQ